MSGLQDHCSDPEARSKSFGLFSESKLHKWLETRCFDESAFFAKDGPASLSRQFCIRRLVFRSRWLRWLQGYAYFFGAKADHQIQTHVIPVIRHPASPTQEHFRSIKSTRRVGRAERAVTPCLCSMSEATGRIWSYRAIAVQ